MIVSHRHKFIFVKTSKTAGTSIEKLISAVCDESDVITPIYPKIAEHYPRNYEGFFNPYRELIFNLLRKNKLKNIRITISDFLKKRKFYNHMPASVIRSRIKKSYWQNYYKFSVIRNPYEKLVSNYEMRRSRGKETNFESYVTSNRSSTNWKYIADQEKIILDNVIYYENLTEELQKVFNLLNLDLSSKDLPMIKVSMRKDYREYYTGNLKDVVAKRFENEITYFDYKF